VVQRAVQSLSSEPSQCREMVRNRTIQVRLTKDQYEQIWAVCRSRGFSHLSSYIRFVALHQDLVLQQKVHEIHRHLLGERKTERRRKPLGDMPRNF